MALDLELLQKSIEAKLKSTAGLSSLEIMSEDRRDIVNAIESALNKLGLCIIVQTVDAEVSKPNLPGPVFDPVTVSVQVHENVLLNRSKTDSTALKIAQDVASALHHQVVEGAHGPLCCKGIFYQEQSRVLSYAVDFKIGV
jgi:hypothetical protein